MKHFYNSKIRLDLDKYHYLNTSMTTFAEGIRAFKECLPTNFVTKWHQSTPSSSSNSTKYCQLAVDNWSLLTPQFQSDNCSLSTEINWLKLVKIEVGNAPLQSSHNLLGNS